MRSRFSHILPESSILGSPEDLGKYGRDWLKDFEPNPSLILLPRTTEEVSEILKICNREKIPVVPSGGRTGLSGGAAAVNGEVVLSLEKMNRVIGINSYDRTLTCQAGLVTQAAQEAALEKGLYFPVDFASKGSSQIGGNIATNAGGIRVIRYGNIRDWVVGLKVVTAGGDILELNGSLFKNQTGYDLKSLFIGSEGTLGIITEATLRLILPPSELIRIICAVKDLKETLEFLAAARGTFGTISAFEYFSGACYDCVVKHHSLKNLFDVQYKDYILVEFEAAEPGLREKIENFLGDELESETILDAVISQNVKQCDDFMRYRELISETISSHYVPHKNDISVPISSIPAFLEKLHGVIGENYPLFQVLIFGHLGDGNLHVNIIKPEGMENREFFRHCKEADHKVFELVREFKGSISAEHGVGLLKRDFLGYSRSEYEVNLMREIRKVFDPNGILNPGKIFI